MPYTAGPLPLPFIAQSETSRNAAIAAQSFAPTQLQRYIAFMKMRHRAGATDKEASRLLDIQRSSLCCRRAEALAQGLIEKTTYRREGCAVYAWRQS